MPSIKIIEKKWVDNFQKCPLVEKESGTFNSSYAHQLFYGRQEDSYPDIYPNNFNRFYSSCDDTCSEEVIECLVKYLHFIGIRIRKEAISKHLEIYPADFEKLKRKCYYIFKTLAHYGQELNVASPFYDNNGDVFFLLRIESEESINGGQLNLFEDIELPDLYGKFTKLPDGYENDPIIIDLFNRIENNNNSYFITGKAGTGKSTFVQYFAQKTKKKVLLTAFTGIAAINIGGQTIHSFFQLPPRPLMPEDEEISLFGDFTQKFKIIQQIDTIVIDEVSMLRSDLLEALDYSLRKNGGDPLKKFGGKQILFVGDIFQLPPVVDPDDEVENELFSIIYEPN